MILTVNLGDRSYPVLLNESDTLVSRIQADFPARRYAIVTNKTIARLYQDTLDAWTRDLGAVTHIIEDGEQFKTLDTWREILDTLLQERFDRKSLIIAFGGGVVGDISGFAAASFLRGVDFIQVPTTLLAMVDSSVGGKTGVNHQMGKNLIGAFHQPRMVYIATSFLDTLKEREFIAGYGEVFKYAFIGGRDMFDFILANHSRILARESAPLGEAIQRSIEIKAAIVAQDERESGTRALLNFGHTFGHALESFFHYSGILHGEAVIWGIRCACDLAERLGLIEPSHRDDYEKILALTPPVTLPAIPPAETLYTNMFSDKKTSGGTLRFVLPHSPGNSSITATPTKDRVIATIDTVLAQP